MSVSTAPARTNNSGFGLFLTLLLLLAALVALAVGALSPTHAIERHGSDAISARSCSERPDFMFFNPSTGRTAFVCLLPNGLYGVHVLNELQEEVTAFVKNKMKTSEQVKQYLRNCGYGELP